MAMAPVLFQSVLLIASLSVTLATETTTTTTVIKYYNDLVQSLPSQHGKCVAITGTTSGLGFWAAVATAKKGASCLIMLNRNSSRAIKAEEEVKKVAAPGVVVVTITCDLQNIASVRTAAADVNQFVLKFGGLDVLAMNAGVMGENDTRTSDGFDVTMQTNYLSHFLLAKLLMPSLRAANTSRGEVRIVTQSSLDRGGWPGSAGPPNASYFMETAAGSLGGRNGNSERYHQSKLAMIVFSMALHAKFASTNGYALFKSLSVAPGIATTHLKTPPTWPLPVVNWMKKAFALSPPDGSCSLVTAMYAPTAKSGDFYEPEWIVNGPPYRLIAEGVPNKLAEIPRIMLGCTDQDSCSVATGIEVWNYSEAGLGVKFIIDDSYSLRKEAVLEVSPRGVPMIV